MSPIELGKFIAKLRNEKGLTQDDLAEKLFIDKRKISRWECGTSIPDFDLLIKLSEILDVSLYELSICKKIENEKLTKKIINSFKNITDYKKYSYKRKIISIIFLIVLMIFIVTLVFTIKNHDTVTIYQLTSLDDKYYIEGNYIKAGDYNTFYINKIINNNESLILNNCEYEIFDKNNRIFHIIHNQSNNSYFVINDSHKLDDILDIHINCKINKKEIKHIFKIKLTNIYNNKLF
jgi:transcriptional regulator with XRE-family HTH domain